MALVQMPKEGQVDPENPNKIWHNGVGFITEEEYNKLVPPAKPAQGDLWNSSDGKKLWDAKSKSWLLEDAYNKVVPPVNPAQGDKWGSSDGEKLWDAKSKKWLIQNEYDKVVPPKDPVDGTKWNSSTGKQIWNGKSWETEPNYYKNKFTNAKTDADKVKWGQAAADYFKNVNRTDYNNYVSKVKEAQARIDKANQTATTNSSSNTTNSTGSTSVNAFVEGQVDPESNKIWHKGTGFVTEEEYNKLVPPTSPAQGDKWNSADGEKLYDAKSKKWLVQSEYDKVVPPANPKMGDKWGSSAGDKFYDGKKWVDKTTYDAAANKVEGKRLHDVWANAPANSQQKWDAGAEYMAWVKKYDPKNIQSITTSQATLKTKLVKSGEWNPGGGTTNNTTGAPVTGVDGQPGPDINSGNSNTTNPSDAPKDPKVGDIWNNQYWNGKSWISKIAWDVLQSLTEPKDTTKDTTVVTAMDLPDSLSILRTMFAQYGLQDLAASVSKYQTDPKFKDATGKLDDFLVMQDLREQPSYKNRFAAKLSRDAAIQAAGQAGQTTMMQPISEGDQLALEKQYSDLAKQAGLPVGFYDNPSDFTTLITNDVSPDEYTTRIDMAQQAALQSNADLRDQLQNQFGIGEGDLTAFFLDPNKAREVTAKRTNDLVRQFNEAALLTAGISGDVIAQAAQNAVPANVNVSYLKTLANENLGLAQGTVAGEKAVVSQQQVANVLIAGAQGNKGNPDYEAQKALETGMTVKRKKYESGGSIAATDKGVIGLGKANN
jgi:hypothetical protein